MRVTPEILETADDVGSAAAAILADGIEAANRAGRRFVLGCPSGRSGKSTYLALAREVHERALDLGALVIAMMDEYVEPDGVGYRPISPDLAHSCVGFGRREIVAPLSEAAGPGRGIPSESLWAPDPSDPGSYDGRLSDAGGIDVFLLASGATDGHVALNPVGAEPDSRTRVVELMKSTRQDNLLTFPSLPDLGSVPRFGITVGIATIRELSRSVIMLTIGAGKTEAVRRLAAAWTYEPTWPATVLSDCRDPQFFADREAAALLRPAP
jgi:glucosamine-6-phosphate deaminase